MSLMASTSKMSKANVGFPRLGGVHRTLSHLPHPHTTRLSYYHLTPWRVNFFQKPQPHNPHSPQPPTPIGPPSAYPATLPHPTPPHTLPRSAWVKRNCWVYFSSDAPPPSQHYSLICPQLPPPQTTPHTHAKPPQPHTPHCQGVVSATPLSFCYPVLDASRKAGQTAGPHGSGTVGEQGYDTGKGVLL